VSKTPPPRPDYRSESNRFYEWAALIRDAKKTPGVYWIALFNVPIATVRAVRERRHPDLRPAGGRLDAKAVNAHVHDGRTVCDLLVAWLPDTPDVGLADTTSDP